MKALLHIGIVVVATSFMLGCGGNAPDEAACKNGVERFERAKDGMAQELGSSVAQKIQDAMEEFTHAKKVRDAGDWQACAIAINKALDTIGMGEDN